MTSHKPFGDKHFFIFALTMLVIAAFLLIAFGLYGLGRRGAYATDFLYFYSAGKVWLSGEIPYVYESFRATALESSGLNPRTSFAYPPTISLFSFLFALLPLSVAKIVMGAINIAAVFVLCWVAKVIATCDGQLDKVRGLILVLAAVVVGNPYTAHVIWMGQTSLVVAAASSLAFIWAGRERYILAGVMLSLASIKPQLSLLVGFWLLLERQYKTIGVAGVASIIFSLPALVSSQINLPLDWLAALKAYRGGVHDIVSFRHVFGFRSWMSDFGVIMPSLLPVALVCTVALFWKKDSFRREDILPVLVILSLTFIYSHDYDLAAFFIGVGCFVRSLYPSRMGYILITVMLVYICIPQRLVLLYIFDAGHYREPVFLMLASWLLFLLQREKVDGFGRCKY